jgi:hypothetical protein
MERRTDNSGTQAAAKKPYSCPTLTTFGDVAVLTQSATGCTKGDGAGCVIQPGADMGPMA